MAAVANGSPLGFAVDIIGAAVAACLAATCYGLLATGAENGSPVLKAAIGLLAGIAGGAFEVYC